MGEKQGKEIVVGFDDLDFSFLKIEGKTLALIKVDEKNKKFVLREVKGEEIDEMVGIVAARIKRAVTKKMMSDEFIERAIKEGIKTIEYKDLVELEARTRGEFSIKPVKGCFALDIGGKQGRPLKLHLAG